MTCPRVTLSVGHDSYPPDKVIRKVGEVVRPWYICMGEEILLWILGIVAVPQEQLK